jgi:hypothetical protein
MMLRLLVAVAALLCATVVADARGVCDFRLRPDGVPNTDSNRMRQRIERAIVIVNAAVGDPNMRLALSDDDVATSSDGERIPVLHIATDPDRSVVAEVPAGCRGIVVDGSNFGRNFAHLAADNVLMQGKQVEMLVFLLLHELGHISNGDYAAFLPRTSRRLLNVDTNVDKQKENKADEFVAQILKREMARLGNGEVPPESLGLNLAALDAVLFLSSLSFVVSTRSTLDCFGCRTLGLPQIFWDHSYSHPNLELRLLRINYAIDGSETSKELLDTYERKRAAAIRERRLNAYQGEED